ncbi:MAG: matrixin family metalloprotease [Planctomycetes bacterium]|nr:matrixin family metalloprotease [Planctomycetota bacterium]
MSTTHPLRRYLFPSIATLALVLVAGWPTDEAAAYAVTGSKFNSPTVNFRINPSFIDASAGNANAQVAAIRAGADEWRVSGQGNFTFNYAGETAVATVAADGVNTVYYSNTDGNGPLAACYWWSLGGSITNFDIVFFDRMVGYDFVWATSPAWNQFDIQSVACHELGHALGLDHSAVAGATMAPTVSAGSIANRSVHNDDAAGMQFLYGQVGPLVPVVSNLAANHGFLDGGGTVQIAGSNFPSSGCAVKFGGVSATNVVWKTPSLLSCTVPAAGNGGPVSVAVSVGAVTGTTPAAYIYDHCRFGNTPAQGSWNWVQCRAPGDAGLPFLAMLSFSSGSIPLSSFGAPSDPRVVSLGYDDILATVVLYGTQMPQWLNNPLGFLDASANTTFGFFVPPTPSLAGLTLHVGFLSGDAAALSGIRTVSGTISATL